MIHVIATITVVPGSRPAFLKHFHALVPHVHAEVGCIEYGPTIDIASDMGGQIPLRDNVVIVVERWATLKDLQAHHVAPHMQPFRESVKGLVESVSLQVTETA